MYLNFHVIRGKKYHCLHLLSIEEIQGDSKRFKNDLQTIIFLFPECELSQIESDVSSRRYSATQNQLQADFKDDVSCSEGSDYFNDSHFNNNNNVDIRKKLQLYDAEFSEIFSNDSRLKSSRNETTADNFSDKYTVRNGSDDLQSDAIDSAGVTPSFHFNVDNRCESVYENVDRNFGNFDLTIEKFQFLKKVDDGQTTEDPSERNEVDSITIQTANIETQDRTMGRHVIVVNAVS